MTTSAWCFNQPSKLKCRGFLVSKFAFKWVNLYRYNLADVLKDSLGFEGVKMSRRIVVGLLYKLNPVDPWLESTLFQPLSL